MLPSAGTKLSTSRSNPPPPRVKLTRLAPFLLQCISQAVLRPLTWRTETRGEEHRGTQIKNKQQETCASPCKINHTWLYPHLIPIRKFIQSFKIPYWFGTNTLISAFLAHVRSSAVPVSPWRAGQIKVPSRLHWLLRSSGLMMLSVQSGRKRKRRRENSIAGKFDRSCGWAFSWKPVAASAPHYSTSLWCKK